MTSLAVEFLVILLDRSTLERCLDHTPISRNQEWAVQPSHYNQTSSKEVQQKLTERDGLSLKIKNGCRTWYFTVLRRKWRRIS